MSAKRKNIRLKGSVKNQVFDRALVVRTLPDPEEIARAIWLRQHSALSPDAINYRAKWRDQSIPLKYWDEFVLDAKAVLKLLGREHSGL